MQQGLKDAYALIGLLATRFAALDALLNELLATLIHPNNSLLATVLTDGIDFSRAVRMIRGVARVRAHDLEDRLEPLLASASNHRGARNEFIHGTWRIEANPDGTIQATCRTRRFRSRREGESTTWSTTNTRRVRMEELRNRASQIHTLCVQIAATIEDLKADPEFEIAVSS